MSASRPPPGPALVPATAWETPPEQPAGGTPKWPPFAPPNIARSSRGGASRDTSVRDRPGLFPEHGLLKWQGRLELEVGQLSRALQCGALGVRQPLCSGEEGGEGVPESSRAECHLAGRSEMMKAALQTPGKADSWLRR